MKIQLTVKVREKKSILLSQTEEYNPGDRPSGALRTIPPVRNGRNSHITFQDKGIIHPNDILIFYIKFTKDIQSR